MRIKNYIKWCAFLCMSILLMICSSADALAATKTISSVSIRVRNRLQIGDELYDDNISINADTENGVSVFADNSRYTIESASFTSKNSDLQIGDEVKIKVRLVPVDEETYRFKGSYSSSNVSISGGGSYVSSSKSGTALVVTIKLNPLNGTYDPPENVEWHPNVLGRATWDEPYSTSGRYTVVLYRGSQQVQVIENIGTTAINLSSYMTQKGTYKFRVCTVPVEGSSYGKRSEYIMSDEIYIDEETAASIVVSPITTTSTGPSISESVGYTTGTVGWIHEDNNWYYRYPDGTYKQNGWELVSNQWYLFDSNGSMLTGWQYRNGYWYYLSDSGAMSTGWINANGNWYYLEPDMSSPIVGHLYINRIFTPANSTQQYYVREDGSMAVGWTNVLGGWRYFYADGSMARNTIVDTFYVDANGVWNRS